jgi:hypothetical protein
MLQPSHAQNLGTPSSSRQSLTHMPDFCRSTSGPRQPGQGLGLFFTAHLQSPILFLDTLSFPTDTGLQFPSSHFNKMAPEVLSASVLVFSTTCSKKAGWTWQIADSSLLAESLVLKGQLQTPLEALHADTDD